MEFPEVGGYPVGGDFEIKYYMIRVHYNNPHKIRSILSHQTYTAGSKCLQSILDRRDSTGIRFYLGKELRQYDLGYLTLGTESSPDALAIPPRADRFIVDSYCSGNATKV